MHAHGSSLDASNYAAAVERLGASSSPPGATLSLGFVVYDLASHAIELALKAFLLLHGVDAERLRKRYGHDPLKLLRKAKSAGLDPRLADAAKLRACVECLDMPHRERSFGYPRVQVLRLPTEVMLAAVVRDLVDAVHELCRGALYQNLRAGNIPPMPNTAP